MFRCGEYDIDIAEKLLRYDISSDPVESISLHIYPVPIVPDATSTLPPNICSKYVATYIGDEVQFIVSD